jgi:hypothetical protein
MKGLYQHRSESIFEIELTDSQIVNYIIKPDNTCGSGSPGTVRLSAKKGHPARSELFSPHPTGNMTALHPNRGRQLVESFYAAELFQPLLRRR